MKESTFTVRRNRPVAADTFELRLDGDAADSAPGRFVEIALPGRCLRRPFSLCDWDGEGLSVVYRKVGAGTGDLSALRRGEKLSVLTGLGNGFDTAKSGGTPLLVGGGTGASPLLGLAKALAAEGKRATVILGFASAREVILAGELSRTGARVIVATEDGTRGLRGVVTDAMDGFIYSAVYACGPEAMLKAVFKKAAAPCYFSLEARMGCGFGVCMGCTIETKSGPKRVCRDGPVFAGEELLWRI